MLQGGNGRAMFCQHSMLIKKYLRRIHRHKFYRRSNGRIPSCDPDSSGPLAYVAWAFKPCRFQIKQKTPFRDLCEIVMQLQQPDGIVQKGGDISSQPHIKSTD